MTLPLSATKLSENGMFSPDGTFYPCESGYHDMTCEQIIDSTREMLESSGWVFIIKSKIFHPHPFTNNWNVTQLQYAFLRGYIEDFPDPLSMFWEFRIADTKR